MRRAIRGRSILQVAGGFAVVFGVVGLLVWLLASPEPAAVRWSHGRLRWSPPALTRPERVQLSASRRIVDLAPDRDYIVELPKHPLVVPDGLQISGGHNVVLIGGEIHLDGSGYGRGLYLKGQTGTVHVEGLYISGHPQEGINLDERDGARVQLENIKVDQITGSRAGHHADLIQTWAGPSELFVHRFVGSTNYQGFFFLPTQHFDGAPPKQYVLDCVQITGVQNSAYLLWRDRYTWPVHLSDVWVSSGKRTRRSLLWPEAASGPWRDAHIGTRPTSCLAGDVGVGYRTPG